MTDIQKPDAPDEDIDARIACVLAEYEAHDRFCVWFPSSSPLGRLFPKALVPVITHQGGPAQEPWCGFSSARKPDHRTAAL
ncbi:hypothetical protein [Paracoccus actinidiae]|uniref:hypothetical protein n=1 Tax=Paracoccus actinidiae TaxID=3064531 RepID=UPI0027D25814|nr:hypothetical protein [Paracoccus sp. M09]